MTENLFDVLDLPQEATSLEIKTRFRELALKWHPDKNHDPAARSVFIRIYAAYDILTDPEKRTAYDRSRSQQTRERRSTEPPRQTAKENRGWESARKKGERYAGMDYTDFWKEILGSAERIFVGDSESVSIYSVVALSGKYTLASLAAYWLVMTAWLVTALPQELLNCVRALKMASEPGAGTLEKTMERSKLFLSDRMGVSLVALVICVLAGTSMLRKPPFGWLFSLNGESVTAKQAGTASIFVVLLVVVAIVLGIASSGELFLVHRLSYEALQRLYLAILTRRFQ